MMLSSVVLPAPEGPMMVRNSPSRTEKLRSWITQGAGSRPPPPAPGAPARPAAVGKALGGPADLEDRLIHDRVPACNVTSDGGRQRSSARSSAFTLQLPRNTMQVVAASATKIPVVSKFIAP